ncbi:MAG TPA: NGG1p interacting factor NIF3 [Anaerolinea thermolimosa]|uniref:GTP cyclohydrolase 1 type 2 homolog n=1 Tax=Anaerolinea thermolimosa TaxID=229919 RepID=A0A3D1JHP6_9CHLR|nr:Nif3-like dinuclear metal center hexameric protein [Anaerolinea thermolimosa]GAP07146.1 uncharacterized conserved protein [Anaerolinea thermolimosa]HCE18032.1 NGG1p interacting factor NIF3 [Anaerolinea thermolimosa]
MITIQEAIHRIQQEVPGEIPADTVDQFKIGDPARPLTGIVTTFIATCKVIEEAAAVGANLIITHEPTFFNHRDEVEWLQKDVVYLSKRRLLEEKGITVWRFHDGWHAIQPDGILEGTLRKLDWKPYQDGSIPYLLHLPAQTLEELVFFLKEKLSAPVLRVAGPRELVCQTAALIPGSVWGEMQVEALGRPDVDVLICGEAPEWQTAEYVRDAVACGHPKGLIILGHERSEEAGMAYLVEWLGERLPDVPIHYLPAGDPIWFL